MINHARTLLLNLDGAAGYMENYPGEELIPANYKSLALPTYLNIVRNRLFGANPDRTMLNYRAAQLLRLIQATELQQYILELDSRITYANRPLIANNVFSPVIAQYRGSLSDRLYLTGNPLDPDDSGICYYAYDIQLDTSHFMIQRQSFPLIKELIPYTFTAGETQPVALPFSGYLIHTNTVSTQAAWTIRGHLRPGRSLTRIETNLRSIGEPELIQLFGTADVEPYTTFKNCWEKHTDFAYRLGGIVLAYIYRSHQLYQVPDGK